MAARPFQAQVELDMIVYSDEPAVVVIGQDAAGIDRLRAASVSAGCRVVDAVLIDEAAEPGGGNAPCLVAAETPSDALDVLLDRIEAEAPGRQGLVLTSPDALDAVFARVGHPNIAILCGASDAELTLHVALASRPAPVVLADAGRRSGLSVLQQLSEDAARLASVLANLSDEQEPRRSPIIEENVAADEVDAAYVRTIIKARRMRDEFLIRDAFADPAFDMLLDLFASHLEGKKVAVSSLCIAAAVPATTALRWIRTMTDQGMFVRVADPRDGRRIYIELSGEAVQAMMAYLQAVRRLGITII